MRVGYCRVSTTKAEQDISLEGQQQQLLAAGCDEVIVERASAFKGQREGMDSPLGPGGQRPGHRGVSCRSVTS